MLTKEFRIILPLTVDEYHIGQLYGVAEMSKRETGGGEGVEVITNEPFHNQPQFNGQYSSGQYTYKIYHLKKKVPAFIRVLAPEGALEVHEKSWNAYPYSKTVYSNPYMKDDFYLSIESIHTPDKGNTDNIHKVSEDKWKQVEVVVVDIVNDPVSSSDYRADEDPSKFVSKKTGRGPLNGNQWWNKIDPVMTCYKLVTAEFKWFGLQTRVEKVAHDFEKRIFLNFHRQVFCWLDQWYGLTIEDIRHLEDATQEQLDQQRRTGQVRGTMA